MIWFYVGFMILFIAILLIRYDYLYFANMKFITYDGITYGVDKGRSMKSLDTGDYFYVKDKGYVAQVAITYHSVSCVVGKGPGTVNYRRRRCIPLIRIKE